jgi:enoyl-CoA hydratase/carnithine racemase
MMTPAAPLVLHERQGAILLLTLNRPEKSNSLHPDLVRQLGDALVAVAGGRLSERRRHHRRGP